MKQLVFATSLALLTVMLFTLAACSNSGKIESINDHDTIYRYKVEKVELLDADYEEENNTERILTNTKEFKYYYSDSEYEFYKEVAINGNDSLQYYFPDLLIVSEFDHSTEATYGSYCRAYDTHVKVRIVLGKVDKSYRPSYKVKGNVATIEYYDYKAAQSGKYVYTEQYDFSKTEKLFKEVTQKMYELRFNEIALEAYEKEMEEKYGKIACLYKTKETVGLLKEGLNVEYHN